MKHHSSIKAARETQAQALIRGMKNPARVVEMLGKFPFGCRTEEGQMAYRRAAFENPAFARNALRAFLDVPANKKDELFEFATQLYRGLLQVNGSVDIDIEEPYSVPQRRGEDQHHAGDNGVARGGAPSSIIATPVQLRRGVDFPQQDLSLRVTVLVKALLNNQNQESQMRTLLSLMGLLDELPASRDAVKEIFVREVVACPTECDLTRYGALMDRMGDRDAILQKISTLRAEGPQGWQRRAGAIPSATPSADISLLTSRGLPH